MKDLWFWIKDGMLWLLETPAAIFYVVFNTIILLIWGAYLGEVVLFCVCTFLGLVVGIMIASVLLYYLERRKKNMKNKQMC